MGQQIDVAIHGPVVLATITPPRGFMNDDTAAELEALLDRVDGDPALRAVVFTGGLPDVFIRHFDVGVLEQRGRQMAARGLSFDPARPVPESPYLRCLRRIETSDRAFIAAINGTAMGGGFELALACDVRIAQTGDYMLGLPEINIGLLPGAGGTQRLPRLIGEGRALDLMLFGRTISPARALDLGIVTECVADVGVRGLELAAELAAKPARAFAHIKRLVRGAGAARAFADERTLFCDLMVDQTALALMDGMNQGHYDIRGPGSGGG